MSSDLTDLEWMSSLLITSYLVPQIVTSQFHSNVEDLSAGFVYLKFSQHVCLSVFAALLFWDFKGVEDLWIARFGEGRGVMNLGPLFMISVTGVVVCMILYLQIIAFERPKWRQLREIYFLTVLGSSWFIVSLVVFYAFVRCDDQVNSCMVILVGFVHYFSYLLLFLSTLAQFVHLKSYPDIRGFCWFSILLQATGAGLLIGQLSIEVEEHGMSFLTSHIEMTYLALMEGGSAFLYGYIRLERETRRKRQELYAELVECTQDYCESDPDDFEYRQMEDSVRRASPSKSTISS